MTRRNRKAVHGTSPTAAAYLHQHHRSHRAFLGGRDVEGVLSGVDAAEPRFRLRGGVLSGSKGAGDGERDGNGDEAEEEAKDSGRERYRTARGSTE